MTTWSRREGSTSHAKSDREQWDEYTHMQIPDGVDPVVLLEMREHEH